MGGGGGWGAAAITAAETMLSSLVDDRRDEIKDLWHQLDVERVSLSPERSLALGILVEAVENVVKARGAEKPSAAARKAAKDAEAWFAAEDYEYVFSFVNICDYLHLSVGAIRAGVAGFSGKGLGFRRRVITSPRSGA